MKENHIPVSENDALQVSLESQESQVIHASQASQVSQALQESQASLASQMSQAAGLSVSVCGTDCSVCYCFGKMCTGCNECSGKVFHVPEGQTCSIYDCTVNKKGFKNCGACSKAPCDIWMKTRDPKYTDEEFAENVRMRMTALM